MKGCSIKLWIFSSFIGLTITSAFAGETSHYTNGVEGIKAGTVPPLGFYWRIYNVFYQADKTMDKNGNALNIGFNATIYALVNRFLWVSDIKFLGADYAANIIIPTLSKKIKMTARGVDDSEFAIGDITIEPLLLAWHKPRYDAAVGLAVYMPVGSYDKTKPASAGKGFWTGMLSVGGTYYMDEERTWSASILARYEINSKKKDISVTPGNDFHFEWGIAKTFMKTWDVGLTGYVQQQVTDDKGSDVKWDKSIHDKVYAIGPEIRTFFPSIKLAVSLRSQKEFGARDRSQGNVTVLTLAKAF